MKKNKHQGEGLIPAISRRQFIQAGSALAALPFVGTQFPTAPWREIALQSVTQGLLSGLVATLLYGTAVRALGGTQAAAYTAITPVAAAIGGAVLLAEPLGVSTLAAALVTGLGVLLSTGLLSRRQVVC